MNYPTRRDRLAAELQARRSRRRRSLTVGALGVTTAAGALLAGVAPASANDGSQQASSYQNWSYQGASSSSSETSTSSASAGATSTASSASAGSAGSTNGEATYQLASYSSGSGYGSGWQADVAQWAAGTAQDSSVGYSYGGNGPSVYDCSGFTQNAFAQAGVDLPRTASAQYSAASQYVGLDELQVGDLVFWSNNGSASGVYHVAIYIGDGQIAHARNPSMGVSITDVDYSPWNMMGTAARY